MSKRPKLSSKSGKNLSSIKTVIPVIEQKNTVTFPVFNKLFYSGFCLTDNDQFALFFVDKQFLFDNSMEMSKTKFELTENNLDMIINRKERLSPKCGNEFVSFENYGLVKKDLFNWITSKFPKCVFSPVTEFFGNNVNTLVAVLQEEYGKPIGVFKTT